jgi:hypothetical protein
MVLFLIGVKIVYAIKKKRVTGMFNIQMILIGLAIFSLPIALLLLQLLFIGVIGLSITHLVLVLCLGAVSLVGAVLIELVY